MIAEPGLTGERDNLLSLPHDHRYHPCLPWPLILIQPTATFDLVSSVLHLCHPSHGPAPLIASPMISPLSYLAHIHSLFNDIKMQIFPIIAWLRTLQSFLLLSATSGGMTWP